MRIHGTVVRWNDDRGFGFVALPQSRDEIFVHISAFPRDGVRPRVGETVSFELETAPDGRKRAQAVWRPGTRTVARSRGSGGTEPRNWARAALYLVGLSAAGVGAYYFSALRHHFPADAAVEEKFERRTTVVVEGEPQPEQKAPFTSAQAPPVTSAFSCDGRTYCSQMTSCAEANYFLRNCPNVKMDGNHDGEPCEQQWCK